MKEIIVIQHPQSEQHTNRMIGSWCDWDLLYNKTEKTSSYIPTSSE